MSNFQNYNSYQQNYEHPSNLGSYNMRQNSYQDRFRKPVSQNYNEEHWCETCDRSFPSLDVLDKHKQQHQKCNIDGCQFIAHPKVITKHIQMQHSSGLYQKIAKLNNPEEIQKWREERKRKYPTKINMEKKAAEIKEKVERGEKMGLHQSRHKNFDKSLKGANNRNIKSGRKYVQRNHRQSLNPSTLTRKSAVPKKVHHVLPAADSLRTLKPFGGIQDILMEDTPEEIDEETKCDFVIDDDDMIKLPAPDNDPQITNIEPKVCGALSSLMCSYESSDDETEDIKDQASTELLKISNKTEDNIIYKESNALIVKNTEVTNANNLILVNDNKSDDDSGPEETKINKIEESSTLEVEPNLVKSIKFKQISKENKPNRRSFIKPKHKLPSTLLQKLLKREVQKERNIILQCIRHVVQQKFYEKPDYANK